VAQEEAAGQVGSRLCRAQQNTFRISVHLNRMPSHVSTWHDPHGMIRLGLPSWCGLENSLKRTGVDEEGVDRRLSQKCKKGRKITLIGGLARKVERSKEPGGIVSS
jgi:hypothetical protein